MLFQIGRLFLKRKISLISSSFKAFSNHVDNQNIKIENIIMTLGKKINKLKEINRMSDEELARKMEVSIDTLRAMYEGKKKPTHDELMKMCGLFHCNITYFMEDDEGELVVSDDAFIDDKTSFKIRKNWQKTHVKLFCSSGLLMFFGVLAFILGAIFFKHFEYVGPVGLDIIVYIIASLAIIASLGCLITGIVILRKNQKQ